MWALDQERNPHSCDVFYKTEGPVDVRIVYLCLKSYSYYYSNVLIVIQHGNCYCKCIAFRKLQVVTLKAKQCI